MAGGETRRAKRRVPAPSTREIPQPPGKQATRSGAWDSLIAARAEAGGRRRARTSPVSLIVWLAMRREVGCLALLAVAVLLSLALAACWGDGVKENAPSAPKATTTPSAPPHEAFVRTCETSVYGTLNSPAWQKYSVIAGPLVFYYADQYANQPASLFAPLPGNDGYYAGQKLLVLLRRGAVATVIVPESNRSYTALLYDPAAWNDRNAYRIEDGESAVTFKACKQGETAPVGGPLNAMTEFNGSFVVAGARCVPLEVLVRGKERTIPVRLSFGAGRCV